MLFQFKRPSKTPDYIIAGLGNPGAKYEFTRHNAGFLCVELLSDKLGFKIDRLKFQALCGRAEIGGQSCLIMKPQTFMNLSGQAIGQAAAFYKIPPERILVVFDDVSLPVGRLRIRRKGSDGGHNGIKSIISQLGSSDFPRIKLGIGQKPHEQYDLADWVTSRFTNDELKTLRAACDNACSAVQLIAAGEIDKAMDRFTS